MKKVVSILLILVLSLIGTIPVFAEQASVINQNEQAVLNKLSAGVSGYYFRDSDLTQAKNYFKTIDMTKSECDAILKIWDEAYAYISSISNKDIDLRTLTASQKQAILSFGKRMCAVLGLDLVYNTSSGTITISKNGVTIYKTDPIVKKTGREVNLQLIAILGSVLAISYVGIYMKFIRNKKVSTC